ncbi:MAG: hypothetical protein GY870_10830 [archaeon]|nr:hypothetical protein [archaeon]
MKKSDINRLIIIGNGFDLHLGLDTSYKGFIKGFFEVIKYRFEEYRRQPSCLFKVKAPMPGNLDIHINRIAKDYIDLSSDILKGALKDIEKKNWTDLERIYYNELSRIYNDNVEQKYDYLDELKKLNLELNEIKKFLSEYLIRQMDKNSKEDRLEDFYDKFSKPFDCKDFDDATLHKKKSALDGKSPSQILILNFNYTNLFKKPYFEHKDYNGNIHDFKVLNIHGRMSEPSSMVFGYGDELDDKYSAIELLCEDEWLRNFKSFSYLKSKDYDKLLGFIELGEFQSWIVGHSCGLSDKTMLKHIFEHDHCINLKAFYHEKEDEGTTVDNFDEICFSISRIMSNKVKMRRIVTKKHNRCNFNMI